MIVIFVALCTALGLMISLIIGWFVGASWIGNLIGYAGGFVIAFLIIEWRQRRDSRIGQTRRPD